MEKWIKMTDLDRYPEVSRQEIQKAMDFAVAQTEANLSVFTEQFPHCCSENNVYQPGPNRNWITGFWTGQVWLAYEEEKDADKKAALKASADIQVSSFLDRINRHEDVDHHDMGFLYSLSCVAAWKLTGSKEGREAALKAADQLISRFQPVGEFIQAWGQMGAKDNYRFIIDCLLNLPLLYWASEETGQEKYRDVAEKHIRTALANVIREDDSTWHTFFMNPETGEPDHGATCQGYKDGSAWARGQAWGVYGTAIGYRYPRDSSSAVIAICGMLEMSRHLEAEEAAYYTSIAGKLVKAMIDRYSVKDKKESNGLLLHGTYSKKSPYNTCTPEGVDECVIWGDYFYMEAMKRFLDPNWIIYW